MTFLVRLRALVAAGLLAGVGAASLLDGNAADFIAGDDGDWFLLQAGSLPTVSSAAVATPQDLYAARRTSPLILSVPDPLPTGHDSRDPLALPEPTRRHARGSVDPTSPRAPPLG